jgi:hypothetical protein
MVELGKHVQVFNSIFVNGGFTTLKRFNASGRSANRHILLKVFRMV